MPTNTLSLKKTNMVTKHKLLQEILPISKQAKGLVYTYSVPMRIERSELNLTNRIEVNIF